jgi:hypothetical protein
VERRHQRHGSHGHFLGFSARLNCEEIPVIPAGIVRSNFNDPRKFPYLLVWKDERNGKIKEAVRLARYVDSHDSRATGHRVELKRPDGSTTVLRTVWRMLPRNGARALLLACSSCDVPCRNVYGWEWDSFWERSDMVKSISWRCRTCARLRYSSEGGYLCPGILFRAFGNLPRPKSWLPNVFTSIHDPRLDEIVVKGRN